MTGMTSSLLEITPPRERPAKGDPVKIIIRATTLPAILLVMVLIGFATAFAGETRGIAIPVGGGSDGSTWGGQTDSFTWG